MDTSTKVNVRSLLVLGKGTVGGQLLAQIEAQARALRERHDVDVRLVGLVDRRASWFDERGAPPLAARAKLAAATSRENPAALLARLARLPGPVLVDCTAADGMEALYDAALAQGVHVVTANKKPLAADTATRDRLLARARASRRQLRYETTVGAALPVIGPLRDLARTGDRVLRIEGSFSGTLGFLSSEVSRGERLSTSVRVARERGYAEPHPAEDLSGADVARKALILAREAGLVLDVADVTVEPFVPRELFAHDDVDAFLAALEGHDAAFEARIEELRRQGLVLRYLATIDPAEGRATVGPVGVPANHPAARLVGTDALVAFRTERYASSPLVVQGAGAGGALTASGVLADVLAAV